MPVVYKTKAKNAQEAHEAVRPTDISRTPTAVRQYLNDEQFKLYEMIWKRTLACQMNPAVFDAVSVDLSIGSEETLFRASGQTLVFPGFIGVYKEGTDSAEDDDAEAKLPRLETGEVLDVDKIYGDQHFTEPPPRYGEASLVKTLEEYGIGRPSTYASIISTLQDREYVVLDKKRFTPTDVGRVVSKFLTEHFTQYVDYDFTANLETALDNVAEGTQEWVPLMDEFWQGFNKQIISKVDVDRPGNELIDESCPKCGKQLQKQLSRYGTFIGCTGYNDEPKCDYKRSANGSTEVGADPVVIGIDETTAKEIFLMNGPYGPYIQLGVVIEGEKKKPKRVSIPKDIAITDVNLEVANMLLSLPRDLGLHPETNKKIVANIGRFGPYVNHDGKFKSIPKTQSVFTIDQAAAVELIAQANKGPAPIADLGEHPSGEGRVEVFDGRYGPYVQHKKIRATLPKSIAPEELTFEEAIGLLAEKEAKDSSSKKPTKKAPAKKKVATKKATTKKTTK
jgi:DNA topoisomerase I